MGRILLAIFLTSAVLIGQTVSSVWECAEDTDCFDGAVCSDNFCQCPPGFTFSTNGYRCLKYSIGYKSSCEDDTQCGWLTGSYVCIDGGCTCGDGYRYFHGRCLEVKGLGEACIEDQQCHVSNYISAMRCSEEGFCVCNEGFYPREGYDCRPEAHAVGDACSLDADCKMDNGFCDRELCATEADGARGGDEMREGISERIITYEIGTPCSTSEDCIGVANSSCSPLTNECICDRGYFFSDGTCIGEIGTNIGCRVNSECDATSRRCGADGACVCTNSQYYTNDLTGCIRVAFQPSFRCTQDLACDIFGKDAVCVLEGFFNVCKCRLGYRLNEETLLCEVNEDGEAGENACVQASDCSNVNAACLNGVCGCPENFRLVENVCMPNIGAECDSDTKICDVENGDCVGNLCSCNGNYTQTGITTCTQVVNELYEPCDYDLQCNTMIENSHCSNGECVCISAFAEIDGQCVQKKNFGEYCVNVRQCRVGLGENIQCRNSICQCPADMIRDGLNCKPKSSAVTLMGSLTLFIYLPVITYYLFV